MQADVCCYIGEVKFGVEPVETVCSGRGMRPGSCLRFLTPVSQGFHIGSTHAGSLSALDRWNNQQEPQMPSRPSSTAVPCRETSHTPADMKVLDLAEK